MESTLLRSTNPTTALAAKHLPTHLNPQKAPAFASKKPGVVCAALNKRGKSIAVQATKDYPEKAAMAEEVEKELEEEGYWEWREMDKCKGCEEEGGILKLMECLEREAIMGEDEGKDPIDYNRRAHIFDKSSKIFQLHSTSVPSS